MREAVADCDDVSSDGSLLLLSPPRDIPEAELPAGSAMEIGTRDADSPIVMPRRVTPANRPLQHLEAGHLGASTPQHVMSRPAVPDLCKYESAIANRPPADGSAVTTHCRGYLLMAGGRSPRYSSCRQQRRSGRAAELGGITVVRGRPRGTYRELCVCRRRQNHPDVGRTTSPSGGGGGDQSSPGWGRHLIKTLVLWPDT